MTEDKTIVNMKITETVFNPFDILKNEKRLLKVLEEYYKANPSKGYEDFLCDKGLRNKKEPMIVNKPA